MGSNNFFKKLKRMYNGKTYFEKYGGDLWLCFILIALFTSISTYFHVSGQINTLKTSWVDNKCNPRYMPFANIMNKDKNISALEYTEQNFISCIGDMFFTNNENSYGTTCFSITDDCSSYRSYGCFV